MLKGDLPAASCRFNHANIADYLAKNLYCLDFGDHPIT